MEVDREQLGYSWGELDLRRARVTAQCSLSRPRKGPAGASQCFPMAASTCHPESTEPLTQVCQVRGRPGGMEGGAAWTWRSRPSPPSISPLPTDPVLPATPHPRLTRWPPPCLNQPTQHEVGIPQLLLTALSCCGQLCSSARELGAHGAAERGINPGCWLV